MLPARATALPGREETYDAVIVNAHDNERTGCLLVEESVDQPGQKWPTAGVAGASPPPFVQQAPQAFESTAANPALENSHEWRDLSGGYGLRMQVGKNDRRYRVARGMDLSIANQWHLGPELNQLTPSSVDSTNGCSKFFELGGKLYFCNGRYLDLRTSDSDWNTGRTAVASASSPVTATAAAFESGKAVVDAITFYSNVSGGANLAYLGMGDTEKIWKFDGAIFTQHASLTARAWCQEGRNLWRSPSLNNVAKVDIDADPWTAGNWSNDNQFTIGDASSAINSMILTSSSVLLFMKTDGIYILDEKGKDHQLYAGEHFAVDSENGKYPYLSDNWVYVTYGRQHYRIGPNLELNKCGPERYTDNDSVVHGYVTRGVETPFANYAGLYNPDSGNSYLMKSTAWGIDQTGQYKKVEDVWHGSLSNFADSSQPYGSEDFSGVKIQAMWKSQIGAASGHERVYMGDSSGRLTWFELPCTANPMQCQHDGGVYKTRKGGVRTGSVWMPYWHGSFPDNPKDVRAATGTGTQLGKVTPSAYIPEVGMREAGGGGNYTAYNDGAGGNFLDTVPSARRAIQGAFTLLDTVVNLYADTDTKSPIINGVGLTYAVRLPIQQIFQLNMLAEDGMIKRDGTPFRMGVAEIQARIKRAAQVDAGVQVYLTDGSLHTLVLGQYTEHTLRDQRTKKARQVVSVVGVDADTLAGTSVIPTPPAPVSAISMTNIDSGTSAVTPSENPSASQLLLLTIRQRVSSAGGTLPVAPTAAGCGLTWVQVATVTSSVFSESTGLYNSDRLTVLRAMGTPTVGAITITVSDASVTAWALDQAANVDTSGSNGAGAVVQSVTRAIGGAMALAAYANANNRPFAAGDSLASTLTALATSPSTKWTASTSPPTTLATIADTFSTPRVAIGIELKAASQA